MALCYNLTYIPNIPGFEHFVARLAELLLSPERPLTAVLDRFQNTCGHSGRHRVKHRCPPPPINPAQLNQKLLSLDPHPKKM
jgi:hypothetical protein